MPNTKINGGAGGGFCPVGSTLAEGSWVEVVEENKGDLEVVGAVTLKKTSLGEKVSVKKVD